MKAIHQVQITADISKPAEEIAEIITLFISMHPAEKQKEILKAVDQSIGEALAGLEVGSDKDK